MTLSTILFAVIAVVSIVAGVFVIVRAFRGRGGAAADTFSTAA